MPEIVPGAAHATFINTFRCEPSDQAIARRFGGLIEFEPHECEVVHVGARA